MVIKPILTFAGILVSAYIIVSVATVAERIFYMDEGKQRGSTLSEFLDCSNQNNIK